MLWFLSPKSPHQAERHSVQLVMALSKPASSFPLCGWDACIHLAVSASSKAMALSHGSFNPSGEHS